MNMTELSPVSAAGTEAGVLARIYQPDCNLAVWQRPLLASLQTAMCPRFHTDRLPCRLVSTYSGPGTHWLNTLQRDQLLEHGGEEPAQWQQLTAGDVALMKGEGWQGQEGCGLWHRSPPVPTGYRRLFLSMDFGE